MKRSLRLPWRGLLPQLFGFVLLPLTALLLVFSFGSLAMHQQAMRNLVGERDERAVRSVAAALEADLNHRRATVETLALLARSEDTRSLQGVLGESEEMLSTFDLGTAFLSPDGNVLAVSGDLSFWERAAASGLTPERGGEAQIMTGVSASPGTVFAVYRSTDRALVIAGAFSPAALARETLLQAFPNEQTTVMIVAQDGSLLYQNSGGGMGESVGDHPGVREALRGESGVKTTKGRQMDETVVAYSQVRSTGWALVAEEPWEVVAGPMLATTQAAPLVLAPLALIFLAALWLVARQVIQPLQSLEAQAGRAAWGSYDEIKKPVGGITEIRQLQAELIHLTQKVQASQQSLHNYIGAITTGQEEERRRLARELHDDTIQALIALKQRVQLARLNLPQPAAAPITGEAQAGGLSPAEQTLSALEEMTEQAIENLRRITRALRPIYLEDLGLATALEMLARESSQAGGVSVRFERQGRERRLADAVELALYRMAQEALSNAARHAQATQATLRIEFGEQVRLSITDNGKGFEAPNSPAEFAPGGHFGLLGMHERAELIGGRLEISSKQGEGTTVRVTI